MIKPCRRHIHILCAIPLIFALSACSNDELKKEFNSKINSVDRKADSNEKTMKEMQRTIESLQAEIRTANAKIKDLEGEIENIDSKIANKSDAPAPTYGENDNSISSLKNRVDAIDSNVIAMQADVASTKESVASANDNVIQVTESILALKTEISGTSGTISQLQNDMKTARANDRRMGRTLEAIKQNSVLELDGKLKLATVNGYPTALFNGLNVQIINGKNQTTVNGLGNLIIGYNEARTSGNPVCSDGNYNKKECVAKGGKWGLNHKNGSHNLVGGNHNSYSQYGGALFRTQNYSNLPYLNGF
ncbi:MAG: hypothetical protein OEY64_00225 [Nitrospinota bacterium]|nr:hypothetical protein [Nitrospinota bacterium]